MQGAETGGYQNAGVLANGTLIFTATLTPAKVVKSTAAEQLFTTATGLVDANDMVLSVEKAAQQANLVIGQNRVAAANSVGLNFGNIDAANDITPTASEAYRFAILKVT